MRRLSVLAALIALAAPAAALAQTGGSDYCIPSNTAADPHDLARPDAPPIQLPSGFTRRQIKLGSYTTWAIEAGPRDSREAVVFFHGNPGNSLDYLGLLRSVPLGTRVIVFDELGFGRADKPWDFPYTLAVSTPLIERAFQELGIDRVHMVGHDIGSVIGIDWAAAHPDRLASAVIFDGGILIGYQDHAFARIWKTPDQGEEFMRGTTRENFVTSLEALNPRPLPREFLDRNYDYYDRATRCAVLKAYRNEGDLDANARRQAAALRPHDLPALVIWGDRDPFVPSYVAESNRQGFPHADIHVYSNSGHWPFVDEEEQTVELMRSFLGAHVVEQAGAKIRLAVSPRHPRLGKRTRFHVRAVVGEARQALPGALVSVLGARVRTGPDGRASVVVTPRVLGLVRTAAIKESLISARKTIRVLRR